MYGGCCLTQRELKLNDYSGIRVEMDNIEDILLVIKGDNDENPQYYSFSSPTETFTFDESILGKTVARIELLNCTEKKNVTNIYNVYLIKKDGTEDIVGKDKNRKNMGLLYRTLWQKETVRPYRCLRWSVV